MFNEIEIGRSVFCQSTNYFTKLMGSFKNYNDNSSKTSSYERIFSRLKLIKIYLSLTMTEERFNNLALISIKNDKVTKLDLNQAITNYDDLKLRKKCLK